LFLYSEIFQKDVTRVRLCESQRSHPRRLMIFDCTLGFGSRLALIHSTNMLY